MNRRKWSYYDNRWIVEDDYTKEEENDVSVGVVIVASSIMFIAITLFVILVMTVG